VHHWSLRSFSPNKISGKRKGCKDSAINVEGTGADKRSRSTGNALAEKNN